MQRLHLSSTISPELGSILGNIFVARGLVKEYLDLVKTLVLVFNDEAHQRTFIDLMMPQFQQCEKGDGHSLLFSSKNYFKLFNIIGLLTDKEANTLLVILEEGLLSLEDQFTDDGSLDQRHTSKAIFLRQISFILRCNRVLEPAKKDSFRQYRSKVDIADSSGKTFLFRLVDKCKHPLSYFFMINNGANSSFGYQNGQIQISAFNQLCSNLNTLKHAFKNDISFITFAKKMYLIREQFHRETSSEMRFGDPINFLFYKFNFAINQTLQHDLLNPELFKHLTKPLELLAVFMILALFSGIELNASYLWIKFNTLYKEARDSISTNKKPVITGTDFFSHYAKNGIEQLPRKASAPKDKAHHICETLLGGRFSAFNNNGDVQLTFGVIDILARDTILKNLDEGSYHVITRHDEQYTIQFPPTSFDKLEMIISALELDSGYQCMSAVPI